MLPKPKRCKRKPIFTEREEKIIAWGYYNLTDEEASAYRTLIKGSRWENRKPTTLWESMAKALTYNGFRLALQGYEWRKRNEQIENQSGTSGQSKTEGH